MNHRIPNFLTSWATISFLKDTHGFTLCANCETLLEWRTPFPCHFGKMWGQAQPTETGTGYLPNTSLERYLSTIPFALWNYRANGIRISPVIILHQLIILCSLLYLNPHPSLIHFHSSPIFGNWIQLARGYCVRLCRMERHENMATAVFVSHFLILDMAST
jgi:hypothetical protein